ncbi:MAG: GNAT family N-acetyltransferase [Flavobacteriaceae bacterium]|nr:MAG: GNAT family N-acetyltransferase [Flavobacteriaceae bacterium]
MKQFKVELIPRNQMETILPLIVLLNEGRIDFETLKHRLSQMMPMNYECVGVYDGDKLIGICGIWMLNKLYAGKHIEPDNVFVLKEYRSAGVGKLMLDWVINYAKEIGCDTTEVNCYVKNLKGKKFWEDQGYEVVGYHMQQFFK